MNAPWTPGKTGIGTRDPYAAYVCDDNTGDTIRAIAVENGWPPEKIHKGGLRNAVQSLSVSASPSILFVDLSEVGDPLADISALAEVCEPGTVVIATGHVNDVRLYRDLLASGIQDYMLKPCSLDHVRDSFSHAQAMLNAPKTTDVSTETPHLMTAVIGARGGCGATTIATSLAWLFSSAHDRNTAVLDLDVHFGSTALIYDVEPGRGLTDAIDSPSRIDGLFIERAMVKAGDKLTLLAAEAPISQAIMTDGSAFYQLQEEMRAAFECTMIDLPRAVAIQHPHLLADVQIVIVACELTLASARDIIRILSSLKTNAPNAHIMIVANRVDTKFGNEVSRKEFETSIERSVDFVIPIDTKMMQQAAKVGKPIVEAARGCKSSAVLINIAKQVIAHVAVDEPRTAVPAAKSGLMSKLGMSSKKPKPTKAA